MLSTFFADYFLEYGKVKNEFTKAGNSYSS